ncbi:tetratricopeptide repeat protein [Nonlabens xiamenensis]|uniref:tetratricopeptide repeat protein n=1 Tax=Nonlabens xiamenensis TaxID=2341043 RepID=UPI001F0CC88C|nr:hypothetical protein [Nonlabens xiamenensis]
MKNNIIIILLLLSIVSCKQETQKEKSIDKITDSADYIKYLNVENQQKIADLQQDIDSMETRLESQPNAVGDLGRLSVMYNTSYDLTADVNHLHKAVQSKERQVEHLAIKPWKAKLGLAQLYIKQHQFRRADSLMRSFTTEQLSKEEQMLYFDIAMELGDYPLAEKMLDNLENPRDYNYLIRAAKWNDFKGDLAATLQMMEKAKKLADQSGNTSLQLWSNSNIADYYGHNGEIDKSYQHYLKTLALDPDNYYALKGIAWIEYAHENDPAKALDILQALQENHPLPDYKLAIAEIKEFQGDTAAADRLREEFLEETSQDKYGKLYNTYRIELLAQGNLKMKEEAIQLAREEVEHRPTPETYDLLGYALLQNNNKEEALKNHRAHVIDKTYEPVAALHTYEILLANDLNEEAREYQSELMEAAYELGPVTMTSIKKMSK